MDVGEELRQRRRCGRGFHHDQDGVPDLLQHRSGAGLAAGSQPADRPARRWVGGDLDAQPGLADADAAGDQQQPRRRCRQPVRDGDELRPPGFDDPVLGEQQSTGPDPRTW